MISNIARRFHIIPHIYIYNDTWNLGNPLWFGHGRRHNGLHCEPLSTESRLHEKHCHWTLTATLFSKKHYHTKKTGFPSFLIHATTQHLASGISGSLMNTLVLRNLSRWLAYFRIFSPAMGRGSANLTSHRHQMTSVGSLRPLVAMMPGGWRCYHPQTSHLHQVFGIECPGFVANAGLLWGDEALWVKQVISCHLAKSQLDQA